jgi:hypothetical protein
MLKGPEVAFRDGNDASYQRPLVIDPQRIAHPPQHDP